MTTRAEFLADAFEAIGIADYQFAVTPEERASARRMLDDMLTEWEGRGIPLGYVPLEDLDDDNDGVDLTLPAWSISAVKANLAKELAPSFGKMPSGGLLGRAKRGLALCEARTAVTPAIKTSRSDIRGGGFYRRWGW